MVVVLLLVIVVIGVIGVTDVTDASSRVPMINLIDVEGIGAGGNTLDLIELNSTDRIGVFQFLKTLPGKPPVPHTNITTLRTRGNVPVTDIGTEDWCCLM